MVGVVLPAQLTVAQVTERLPVASWRSNKMNDLPAAAVGIVIVALPVSVMIWNVPFVNASVIAVLEFAVKTVSV